MTPKQIFWLIQLVAFAGAAISISLAQNAPAFPTPPTGPLLPAVEAVVHAAVDTLTSPTPTPTATPTPIIPTPTPIDTPTPPPAPIDTPTPPPEVEQAFETDNDTRTVANGYVTIFHGGNPEITSGLPAPASTPPPPLGTPIPENEPTPTPTPSIVTVTTVEGSAVILSPSILYVDKHGNPVDPATVPPGTRMQAIEIVDDPNVGQVVQQIMVDL